MEQQRAINALEPFIALSKSATSSRAAADLVTQATSAQNTYVFAELLHTPNIQALCQSPEHASSLKLLEIFAWGTYQDYKNTSNLPSLNPIQTHKLRLLSLLPLLSNTAEPAANSPANASYARLQAALDLPDSRSLEALLSAALSSGLLAGPLDPLHARVAVSSIAPLRDVPPGGVRTLSATLGAWEGRCDEALAELDARVAAIRDNAAKRGARERRRKDAFEAAVEREEERARKGGNANAKRSAPSGETGGADADFMDIDDGPEGGDGRRTTRGAKKIFSKGGR